jgi:hypothetical protein
MYTDICNLPNTSQYKNLNYTEKELGFTRKYKGRILDYKGQPFMVVEANVNYIWIQNGKLNSGCKIRLTYADLRKYSFIT